MHVRRVPADGKSAVLLPGAEYEDSYRVVVSEPGLDAITARYRVMGRTPGWIGGLMALRNRIVRPLGLKAEPDRTRDGAARIGAFPVISRTPDRVVLGLDDKHLDFRVAVDVVAIDDQCRQITATTLVRTHNPLGRSYLALVLPFHRVIVPAMLAQVARA